VAANLFDFAAQQLEHHTSLDRLEARGTLRLALKEAGLDPQGLALAQLSVVFEKLMPAELENRGVADASAACRAVMDGVTSSWTAADTPASSSPDDVFSRLGGD
jgi:hypothetical protein